MTKINKLYSLYHNSWFVKNYNKSDVWCQKYRPLDNSIPILKPLNSLTSKDQEHLTDWCDIAIILGRDFISSTNSVNDTIEIVDAILYLTENGYDVYKLIDKNLAINYFSLSDKFKEKWGID